MAAAAEAGGSAREDQGDGVGAAAAVNRGADLPASRKVSEVMAPATSAYKDA